MKNSVEKVVAGLNQIPSGGFVEIDFP